MMVRIRDFIKENENVPIKIELSGTRDTTDPLRKEVWEGMLYDIPEYLHDREVIATGYGLSAQRHILTVLDERKPERQRLFVDMDGTLAVFTPVDILETLYEKGYFLNLEPQKNVLQAVRTIVSEKPEIEVFILSAYLSDSTYALQEKNAWIDYHLPEIDKEHRVFTPCGSDKKLAIKGGIRSDDYLLDDYTLNLNDWEPPAKGIKLLNGINHTKGTWTRNRIRWDRQPQELADMIVSVMQGKIQIYDNNRNDRIPNRPSKGKTR